MGLHGFLSRLIHMPQSIIRQRVITLAIFIVIMLPCMAMAAAKPVTLQLHWKHQFEFAGFYIADEKGYYAEEGLDVTIKEGGMGIMPIDEVTSGNAQFGVGASEVVLARLNGTPVVALQAQFQHSAAALAVRKDSDIYTPQDLVGKVVEMGEVEQDAEMYAMLRNEGLSPDQIIHKPTTFTMDGLIKGDVDAVSIYFTDQAYYLKERGIPYRIIRPVWYGIDFYGNMLYTSERYLEANEETVKSFLRATTKGWQYAYDHPEEAIDLIINSWSRPPFAHSKAHLLFEYEKTRQIMMPDIVEIGHINPGRFRHMADNFVDLGLASPGYDLSGFVYTQDEKPFNWNHWIVKATGVGGILILLTSVVLLVFNRRLSKEIQARIQTEDQLLLSEQRLSLVLWGADLGYWDWNRTNDELYLDERAANMLGISRRSLQANLSHLLESGHEVAHGLFQSLATQMDDGMQSIELESETGPNGQVEWVMCKGQVVDAGHSGSISRAAGIVMDISMLKAYQHELEELSITDALTAIPNRRHFFNQANMQFEHARRGGTPLTIGLVDLDHFKAINDTYGHLAGDKVLKEFAWLMHSAIRPYDVLARFGGEEFVIMFVDADKQQAKTVMERLRDRTTEKVFSVDRVDLKITFSAGLADISELEDSELEPRTLIAKADKRLYVAKHSGRNKIVIG